MDPTLWTKHVCSNTEQNYICFNSGPRIFSDFWKNIWVFLVRGIFPTLKEEWEDGTEQREHGKLNQEGQKLPEGFTQTIFTRLHHFLITVFLNSPLLQAFLSFTLINSWIPSSELKTSKNVPHQSVVTPQPRQAGTDGLYALQRFLHLLMRNTNMDLPNEHLWHPLGISLKQKSSSVFGEKEGWAHLQILAYPPGFCTVMCGWKVPPKAAHQLKYNFRTKQYLTGPNSYSCDTSVSAEGNICHF